MSTPTIQAAGTPETLADIGVVPCGYREPAVDGLELGPLSPEV